MKFALGHRGAHSSRAAAPPAPKQHGRGITPYTPSTAPAPPRPCHSLPPLSVPWFSRRSCSSPPRAAGAARSPPPALPSLAPLSPRSPSCKSHPAPGSKPRGCEPTGGGRARFLRRLPPSPGRRDSGAAPRTHAETSPAAPGTPLSAPRR